MPSIHQIRGALLEEALLELLRASGYRTINTPEGDDCLDRNPAGLAVIGRGSLHQVDAIADHIVAHPFSNRQRLLIEAKNYNDRTAVGIDTVRNAVGVLKDVAEFDPPQNAGAPARRRYHYQYAVFSASHFSPAAQAYAFAHDVYLLQLTTASRMGAVLEAINDYSATLPRNERGFVNTVDLASLRQQMRQSLQEGIPTDADAPPPGAYPIAGILEAVRTVGASVVAVIARALPILMTPEDDAVLRELRNVTTVSLRIEPGNQHRWSVWQQERRRLFSFDVPAALFARYVIAGAFDRQRALQVKAQFFREIQFVYMKNDHPRVATLRLDENWLRKARQAVGLLEEPA